MSVIHATAVVLVEQVTEMLLVRSFLMDAGVRPCSGTNILSNSILTVVSLTKVAHVVQPCGSLKKLIFQCSPHIQGGACKQFYSQYPFEVQVGGNVNRLCSCCTPCVVCVDT